MTALLLIVLGSLLIILALRGPFLLEEGQAPAEIVPDV